jgi:hypothetical protein
VERWAHSSRWQHSPTARAEMTTLPNVDTKCTAPALIPTVNGNTVRSFSTHGQQSAAKGSLTTVPRSDIRFIFSIWTPRSWFGPEGALNWPYPLITADVDFALSTTPLVHAIKAPAVLAERLANTHLAWRRTVVWAPWVGAARLTRKNRRGSCACGAKAGRFCRSLFRSPPPRRHPHPACTAPSRTAMNKLRIVTIGILGGGSLTGPLRDARRFPSTRWYPVPRATCTTLGFGIFPSFKDHFLSARAKPHIRSPL